MSMLASKRAQACLFVLGILLAGAGAGRIASARAQSAQTSMPQPSSSAPAPTTPAATASDAPEMNTHDTSVPLQSRVSVVPVRVVVRDPSGNAVGDLHKEDFLLYEDGKPQVISNFLVETLPTLPPQAAQPNTGSGAAGTPPPFQPPSRFVALLFDDAHLNLQDLMQARNAANRYLDASVMPSDRIGLFTTSGRTDLDFTDDRAKLHAKMKELLPRTVTAGAPQLGTDCPPMDYYEADLIQNQNDQQAIDVATADTLICQPSTEKNPLTGQPTPAAVTRAQGFVAATALRVEDEGSEETEYAFRRLQEVIRRMSSLPGQRSIVLISPGFIYPFKEQEFSDIVDRAIRESIFINTLDARGLYVPNLGGDISQGTNDPNPSNAGFRTSWSLAGQNRQTDVLMYLADDTGGYSFHGDNDLDAGLRQVVAAPAAYYYIAFTPQNLKYDGHFHSIKVTLKPKEKYTIQARRGYYAPLHGDTPADIANQDIMDAVFSQEEQHGLPVALQTQFYKTDATDAKLAVLAHVDLAHMRFVKADGRNQNDLTVVAALFDRNGNFISGTQRVVEMNLRDETLERLSHGGVTVRTSFDVKPGDYVVRLVVRDSKAAQLSAENGVVEIPY
jgi:VWFA-related protein